MDLLFWQPLRQKEVPFEVKWSIDKRIEKNQNPIYQAANWASGRIN